MKKIKLIDVEWNAATKGIYIGSVFPKNQFEIKNLLGLEWTDTHGIRVWVLFIVIPVPFPINAIILALIIYFLIKIL